MPSLPTILLILAAGSMGATVIAALIAFRSYQEAQSAIFPIVREEESNRSQRARLSIFVWIAITALFFGGWLASLRLTTSGEANTESSEIASDQPVEAIAAEPTPEALLPTIEPSPTTIENQTEVQPLDSAATPTDTPPSALPTLTPDSLQSLLPTFTPEPSPTFTASPEPPTPTPIPPTATSTATPSPIPPPTPAQIPTSAPRTPAPSGIRMGPIKFAEDVTPNIEPVNPGKFFRNGIAKVYAVYPFKGMPKDVAFKAIWYKNGVEIDRNEEDWPWGEDGTGFSFLVPRGKGLYKLELLVNDTIAATSLFEVR